jgi:cell division protein FtsW (lipid II flippase)
LRPPGTHLQGWLARWWEPADAERVAWPLLADVQAEWSRARQEGQGCRAAAIRWAGYLQLARACVAVGARRRWLALLGLDARLLLPLILLGLLGTWLLSAGRLGGVRGPAQLGFLAAGVAVALWAATTSGRQLRLLAPLGAGAGLLVLAAVPCFALRSGGTGRWLRFGPLFVHAALLVVPLILVGLAWLAPRRLWFGAFLLAVLGLLAAQPNLPATGIVAAGAVAVAWSSRSRTLAALLAAVAVAVAVLRTPTLYSAEHLQLLGQQLAARGALFVAAVVLGAGWLAWALLAIVRGATRSDGAGFANRLARGGAVALPAQVALLAATDGAVPLLTFGGSAAVAIFATLGLTLGALRAGPVAVAPSPRP